MACPVPGHDGRARIGSPTPDEDPRGAGAPRLLCCSGRWRSLAEVYALQRYSADGRPTDHKLSNVEIATWSRYLAFAAGTFDPVDVLVPSIAADAPESLQVVRDGFRLLIGLRRADGPNVGVAYSCRFAAAWCEIGFQPARRAINALVEAGVIVESERRGRVRIYVPGGPPPLRAVPDPPGDEPDAPGDLTLGLDLPDRVGASEGVFGFDPEDGR